MTKWNAIELWLEIAPMSQAIEFWLKSGSSHLSVWDRVAPGPGPGPGTGPGTGPGPVPGPAPRAKPGPGPVPGPKPRPGQELQLGPGQARARARARQELAEFSLFFVGRIRRGLYLPCLDCDQTSRSVAEEEVFTRRPGAQRKRKRFL